jgi:nicotinate-nucleotide adenylyltransferase
MRIALFGGSFDPPHRGHVAIARAAAEEFQLDRILFAPAGRQPLKRDGHTASFSERLAMVALTCADADPVRFFASAIDAPNPDGTPNYTVETLEALSAQFPQAELFNLAGADSFQHLAQWREPYRVLALAEWIVVSRPGAPLAVPAGLDLTAAQRSRIHLLDSVHEDIAATHLRERLAQGSPCTDLLTPSVAAYIAQHRPYETGASDRELQRSDN